MSQSDSDITSAQLDGGAEIGCIYKRCCCLANFSTRPSPGNFYCLALSDMVRNRIRVWGRRHRDSGVPSAKNEDIITFQQSTSGVAGQRSTFLVQVPNGNIADAEGSIHEHDPVLYRAVFYDPVGTHIHTVNSDSPIPKLQEIPREAALVFEAVTEYTSSDIDPFFPDPDLGSDVPALAVTSLQGNVIYGATQQTGQRNNKF
jgi:hypothetical protein